MKQFVETQKVTYNLMSYTGFKALLIFSMLAEGPKSYPEICNAIEDNKYLKEKISIDTMRVYINSLKRIGCEIKRIKGEDKVSKYYITSHPFELKITNEQCRSIINIYKSLAGKLSIQDILYLDNLFEKIGKYAKDEEFIQKLRGYSILKDIDKELLKELILYCKDKKQIIISYKSPNSGEKDIEIITNKIEITNGKIYLFGFGQEYKQTTGFLVNRIKSIKDVKDSSNAAINTDILKVTYEVTYPNNNFIPESYEKVINNKNNKYIIEAETNNSFYLKQRLLEFGPECKIISPEDFKNEFIETLKEMKAGYCND